MKQETKHLINAIIDGNLDKVRKWINAGAELNDFYEFTWEERSPRRTPLMVAVRFRASNDILRELIAAGADVCAKNRQGETALALACGDARIEGILQEAIADAPPRKKKGRRGVPQQADGQ